MQQDLHLETATVRESLAFSALCRQPKTTSREDKLAYVDEVIRILEMEDYASAIVGVPGEGLNVRITRDWCRSALLTPSCFRLSSVSFLPNRL